HHVPGLDISPLPCAMAAQLICRVDAARPGRWIEFLVRASAPASCLTPFEFVELGYRRRGFLFDQDIVRHCLACLDEFDSDSWFSINIHPGSLQRPKFADYVLNELQFRKINPERLVLELVEFGGPVELMASRPAMQKLRAAGVRFALDDFGPGFPNLDLVASNLIDFVKLDRSLIRFADVQPGYAALVRGLQALAWQTGVVLVAEGVETPAQADIVRSCGIEWIQGFLYSKPELIDLGRFRNEAARDVC
ncbi:MAG: EAL domain-containing protein, partial [Wenzhouxiangellaceae bacterium]